MPVRRPVNSVVCPEISTCISLRLKHSKNTTFNAETAEAPEKNPRERCGLCVLCAQTWFHSTGGYPARNDSVVLVETAAVRGEESR